MLGRLLLSIDICGYKGNLCNVFSLVIIIFFFLKNILNLI